MTAPGRPMKVRYFVTPNRLSPFLALYGEWPKGRGAARSARRGVQFAIREANDDEAEAARQCCREVAMRWTSLRAMLRDHQDAFGRQVRRQLVEGLRSERDAVCRTLERRAAKVREHEQRKARAS